MAGKHLEGIATLMPLNAAAVTGDDVDAAPESETHLLSRPSDCYINQYQGGMCISVLLTTTEKSLRFLRRVDIQPTPGAFPGNGGGSSSSDTISEKELLAP